MDIINWIIANIGNIAVIVILTVITTVIVYLAVKGKLKQMLYDWVTEAEIDNPSGTGALKFSQVFSKLYSFLPAWLRLVLPETLLKSWIEKALIIAKEKWEADGTIEKLTK